MLPWLCGWSGHRDMLSREQAVTWDFSSIVSTQYGRRIGQSCSDIFSGSDGDFHALVMSTFFSH